MSLNEILLNASATGQSNVIRKLLRKKALLNLDSKDENGRTPLALASMGGHEEVIGLLIEAGANINLQDYQMISPLHYATNGCHLESVKSLVLHNAKLNSKTRMKLRPIDLANYDTPVWSVLRNADRGDYPDIPDPDADKIVPQHAIDFATKPKKKKSSGKKKGKKGKKKKK